MYGARALNALTAAALLSGCTQPSPVNHLRLRAEAAFWPTYQHSADRNAVFEHYSIPKDWTYEAKSQINSGLALVGNIVLLTTFSHKLVALDVRNGRELWEASVKNIAMSTPIVAGNRVYVGTGKAASLNVIFFLSCSTLERKSGASPAGMRSQRLICTPVLHAGDTTPSAKICHPPCTIAAV